MLVESAKLARRRAGAKRPALSVLALGWPDVPGTSELKDAEKEALAVAYLFKEKAYVRKAATEERFKRDAPSAAYIHLAAHGEFEGAMPLYSRILLTPSGREDGALHAYELFRMRLQARLVVLSACETASAHPESKEDRETRLWPGEGIVGLAWALSVAQVPSSILTLWRAGDDPGKDLMVNFYKEFQPTGPSLEGKVSKAAALRKAQLKLLTGRPHPKWWAPFVLVGDWRR
jgi:CHAT domain-containing protein